MAGMAFSFEVYKHNDESFRVETYSNGVPGGNQFCSFNNILRTVKYAISHAESNNEIVNSHVGNSASVYVYSDLKDHYKKDVELFHGIIKFILNGKALLFLHLLLNCPGNTRSH